MREFCPQWRGWVVGRDQCEMGHSLCVCGSGSDNSTSGITGSCGNENRGIRLRWRHVFVTRSHVLALLHALQLEEGP
jgi:hypothetical protein